MSDDEIKKAILDKIKELDSYFKKNKFFIQSIFKPVEEWVFEDNYINGLWMCIKRIEKLESYKKTSRIESDLGFLTGGFEDHLKWHAQQVCEHEFQQWDLICKKCGIYKPKAQTGVVLLDSYTKEKLYYFATPYSKNESNKDMDEKGAESYNYFQAIIQTNILIEKGFVIFSPVVYTHYLHKEYERSYKFWIHFVDQIMERCDGIILAPNWEFSEGCKREFRYFKEMDKEIIHFKDVYEGPK